MDKKIKLNKFVTFDEATNYLSKAFGESVSLAEVYRLVLSKRLTASVRLLNKTCAVDGNYISTKDSVAHSNSQGYVLLDQTKGMVFGQEPCLIDGIWDLPMIGMESLVIENLYQNELNEFATIDVNVKGVFVSQGDRICKLKNVVNFCSDNETKHTLCTMIFPPLRYKDISFIDLIFKSGRKVQEIILKAQRDEAIAAFEEFKSQPSLNFVFEDSKSFDQHSHQLILRTDELLRFSCSNQDDVIVKVSSNEFKPNESSEEGDLLGLIGVLCHKVGIDPSARGVTIAVQKMVELVGVSMSDDCIRQILLHTVQALDNKYPKTELTSKRRNTLLVLIGALCNSADIVPSADNATTVFQYMTKYFGALKSYDFISETLSQVALAIETRQK